MAALARYPDPASPYFIESRGGIHEVYHDHFGPLLTCDCLGEARDHIASFEDEDAARLAAEAADELADLELTETICAAVIARRAA